MSISSLERDIVREAKVVLNNPRFTLRDLLEWSSRGVKQQAGESTAYLPELRLHIAFPSGCDKRKTT